MELERLFFCEILIHRSNFDPFSLIWASAKKYDNNNVDDNVDYVDDNYDYADDNDDYSNDDVDHIDFKTPAWWVWASAMP